MKFRRSRRGKVIIWVMLDVGSNNVGWELLDGACLVFGGVKGYTYTILLSFAKWLFVCLQSILETKARIRLI